MTILASNLQVRLSTAAGAAGDATASTPAGSLGKYISTSLLADANLHNLFDAVTGAEAAAGMTDYRCLFVLNNHATETLLATSIWIESQTPEGADVFIGLDPAGITPKGQAGAQAATIASEGAAPAGVTFSGPTSGGTALSVGDVPAGSCFAVWLRRRVAAGAKAMASDSLKLHVRGGS